MKICFLSFLDLEAHVFSKKFLRGIKEVQCACEFIPYSRTRIQFRKPEIDAEGFAESVLCYTLIAILKQVQGLINPP